MQREKNTIDLAIINLEKTGAVLESAANSHENYSTLYAHYLDAISYESRKLANDLRECKLRYGVS